VINLDLKGSQRKFLRSKAHHIKPSVLIGKNELTDGSIHSIDTSLTAHELIKVKFKSAKVSDADKKLIIDKLNCFVAGSIGKVLILFRQNTDKDKQKIQLPK
tara:strand:+ start:275 stop:580 length:306 start_codon:yes stop_codon:yes gene_type:complete